VRSPNQKAVCFTREVARQTTRIMTSERITFQMNAEAVTGSRDASADDRRKVGLLVSLQIADIPKSSSSLEEVIVEMSEEAAAAGLTPEILASIIVGR
jgi:hypothetical protein